MDKNNSEAVEKKCVLKDVTVSVDVEMARKMLGISGFKVDGLSDDEIVMLALNQTNRYGVTVLSALPF